MEKVLTMMNEPTNQGDAGEDQQEGGEEPKPLLHRGFGLALHGGAGDSFEVGGQGLRDGRTQRRLADSRVGRDRQGLDRAARSEGASSGGTVDQHGRGAEQGPEVHLTGDGDLSGLVADNGAGVVAHLQVRPGQRAALDRDLVGADRSAARDQGERGIVLAEGETERRRAAVADRDAVTAGEDGDAL